MSDLVTGEAVAVELPHAKLASRALAFGLDVLLQGTVFVFLVIMIALPSGIDNALRAALSLLVFVGIFVGYPVTFETLSRGRTLGKMALGLRVVRDDGGPIRFRHALARGLCGVFVDFWGLGLFGFVAVVTSLLSTTGKRVGDHLAGTVVISVRAPVTQAYASVPMPPQLTGWAGTANVAGLPDRLALMVRQYLGRYHQLDPGPRERLGMQLAGDVESATGTPRPPDVPPWAYLSAVLATRRTQEQTRVSDRSPWQPPASPPPVAQPPDFATTDPAPRPPSDKPFAPPG